MLNRLIKKALKSRCRYRVAALGVNKKGEVIGVTFNQPRFCGEGGSLHAEISLMQKYGRKISTIYICRVNRIGGILPIHPCKRCREKSEELGIKILSITDAKMLERFI